MARSHFLIVNLLFVVLYYFQLLVLLVFYFFYSSVSLKYQLLLPLEERSLIPGDAQTLSTAQARPQLFPPFCTFPPTLWVPLFIVASGGKAMSPGTYTPRPPFQWSRIAFQLFTTSIHHPTPSPSLSGGLTLSLATNLHLATVVRRPLCVFTGGLFHGRKNITTHPGLMILIFCMAACLEYTILEKRKSRRPNSLITFLAQKKS